MLLVSRSSLTCVSCVSVLVWSMSLPVAAEEKANITPPSKKDPDSLTILPNGPDFQPFDAANSLGRLLDRGGGGAPPTVEAPGPDAKTQMEIMERLDRRRNFLLITVGDNANLSNLKDGSDWTGDNRPRSSRDKPQTALERYWYQSLETSSANPSALPSKDDEKDLLKSPTNPLDSAQLGSGKEDQNTGATWTTTGQDLIRPDPFGSPLGEAGKLTSPLGSEDLRSSWATTPGRDLGFDAFSRQRLERFQQSSGGEGTLRRGLDSDVVEGRARELRLDALDNYLRPSPSSPASITSSPDPVSAATATVDRLQLLTTSVPGVQNNPYNSASSTPPPIAPSARLLKEPRPEPPRFRP